MYTTNYNAKMTYTVENLANMTCVTVKVQLVMYRYFYPYNVHKMVHKMMI